MKSLLYFENILKISYNNKIKEKENDMTYNII